MATGVQPRDDENRLTRADLETIQDAMKNKKFRDLLSEYCEEIRDPANQEIYQKEMTQLEKERGYDVTFINPKGGYVIKTSVAGDRKAFINICSNENVVKPTYTLEVVNGQKGMNWQIPYSIIPPREDFDRNRQRCVIYDVVFHPDTLRMAEVNTQFRDLVNKTAIEALKGNYNINLDQNNLRFPKAHYKGMSTPAVIRKEDPNYEQPGDEELENMSPEMLDKLYPQRIYSGKNLKTSNEEPKEAPKAKKAAKPEFIHSSENGYTIPKYLIKQQKNVDLQDFTYHKDCKQYCAIPSHIVVEINLPLLSSTKDCTLDVQEKSLHLASEKPAKYKLDITLPYSVNDECGTAKFDKSKHMLIVTLPVITRNNNQPNSQRIDSGVESEENSGAQSDEDNNNSNLVVELSSTPAETPRPAELSNDSTSNKDRFLNPSVSYVLPTFTHNVLDDIIAFTFHVKNTEPDSVQVIKDNTEIYIKFTSIGAGYVPVHYAAIIAFDDHIQFNNITGEAWDNNVILQLELTGEVPQKFRIGLTKESMTCDDFDVSQVKKNKPFEEKPDTLKTEVAKPVIEVTNLGTETNIVVSSNHADFDEDDFESTPEERDIVFTDLGHCESGAKSILRKSSSMMRSFSESSAGDVASSMDYISSDCIPEESSLKKTVRFNDVIAKQFYRYNSSIEGQKKKNQRKKSKKRSLERRKSESEAEDDVTNCSQSSKLRLKSALKPRRDSGLADTSDAETECKGIDQQSYNSASDDDDCMDNTNEDTSKSMLNIVNKKEKSEDKMDPDIWESNTTKGDKSEPQTRGNVKHNTELYDPDKLNKGQYLEVTFKNDLIFDLDM